MNLRDTNDIYIGAKSGAFKGVKFGSKEYAVKNIQSLVSITANDEITTISWSDEEETELLIGCGVKDIRSVKVYDTECSTFTCSFFCDTGEGKIVGISRYDETILTAVHSGEIKLWKFKEEDEILVNAGENLRKMRQSKVDKSKIATGGLENGLKLFDLGRQKKIFQEKNLPHDWLQLRVPICISDIEFLPGTEQIVTCGQYGHVRLYDPKAQRRPVINLEVKDESLTALTITPREKQIIVGSGKGRMNLIDLRKSGKILNTYKGFAGSITGIACSANAPHVVSVSLDRFLRIHHIDTKKLLKKVYSTSRLTCMALRSGFSISTEDETMESSVRSSVHDGIDNLNIKESRDSQENTSSDTEYEMLFDKMPVISNKEDNKLLHKKRRKLKKDSLLDNENISVSLGQDSDRSLFRNSKVKSLENAGSDTEYEMFEKMPVISNKKDNKLIDKKRKKLKKDSHTI